MEWLQGESTLVIVLLLANVAQWRWGRATEKAHLRERAALYEQAERRELSRVARLEESTESMRGVQRAVTAMRAMMKAGFGHMAGELSAIRKAVQP